MTRPIGIVDLPIKDSVILYSLRTLSLSEVISEDITGRVTFVFLWSLFFSEDIWKILG